ncbi:MAG: hypothetical protein ABFD84_03460 [Candidatus Polarisedimenticolia bacterium]|nr:hypothetical protein [bacterium]
MKSDGKWLVAAFAAVCALQIAAPVLHVARAKHLAAVGTPFKVRVSEAASGAAVSGRYIVVVPALPALRASALPKNVGAWRNAWAALRVGPDGFATAACSADRPASGPACKVWLQGGADEKDPLITPLLESRRFFVPEDLALLAERTIREHAAPNGPRDAWVAIRIDDDLLMAEGLYIGDVPLLDFLRSRPTPTARNPASKP